MSNEDIERCYKYFIDNGGKIGYFPPALVKSLIAQHVNPFQVCAEDEITLHDSEGRFLKRIKR